MAHEWLSESRIQYLRTNSSPPFKTADRASMYSLLADLDEAKAVLRECLPFLRDYRLAGEVALNNAKTGFVSVELDNRNKETDSILRRIRAIPGMDARKEIDATDRQTSREDGATRHGQALSQAP